MIDAPSWSNRVWLIGEVRSVLRSGRSCVDRATLPCTVESASVVSAGGPFDRRWGGSTPSGPPTENDWSALAIACRMGGGASPPRPRTCWIGSDRIGSRRTPARAERIDALGDGSGLGRGRRESYPGGDREPNSGPGPGQLRRGPRCAHPASWPGPSVRDRDLLVLVSRFAPRPRPELPAGGPMGLCRPGRWAPPMRPATPRARPARPPSPAR